MTIDSHFTASKSLRRNTWLNC